MTNASTAETPHYVKEYREHVKHLLATMDRDAAMVQAVGGGDHLRVGFGLLHLLRDRLGLMREGLSILDMGCGSGRLARVLGDAYGDRIQYLGTDIVEELLEYAAEISPSSYRFLCHTERSYPAEDNSIDLLTAFSVFTHIYPEETYIYFEDAARVLRPGGALVMSFIEIDKQWHHFELGVEARKRNPLAIPAVCLDTVTIATLGKHAGLVLSDYIWSDQGDQSVCVLKKR